MGREATSGLARKGPPGSGRPTISLRGPGPSLTTGHLGPETEQRVLDAAGVDDPGGPDDDRVLDLGVADIATGADGAERPDETVRDLGARPDDGRAAHMAAHQAGAGLDNDPAVELAFGVDLAVNAPFHPLQQEAVGLEQRRELPGVDPPPAQDLGEDHVASVDQPLDGVGDLELAPPRRLDGAHRLVDLVVEEVHADQGED